MGCFLEKMTHTLSCKPNNQFINTITYPTQSEPSQTTNKVICNLIVVIIKITVVTLVSLFK